MAGRFVEFVPTAIVGFDLGGESLDEASRPDAGHQFLNPFDSDVVNHDPVPCSLGLFDWRLDRGTSVETAPANE
jgi:hypothetical protein